MLKGQLKKFQEENAQLKNQLEAATDSEELKIEDLDEDMLMSRNKTPIFEGLRSSDQVPSSGKHFARLSSINDSSLDLEDFEKRLRLLYSHFFSNEYKTSQDKIRNKNQVFKQLFSLCVTDLQTLREHLRHVKKEGEEAQKQLERLHADYEVLREELEQCHRYSIKIISRVA